MLSLVTLAFQSCTKVEGEGGSSSIVGKLNGQVFDGAGNLLYEYDLMDHDVFIIYGDDETETFYDDDIKTSYDGTFRFDFLENGKYRFFTYAYNNTSGGETEVIFFDAEITDKKSTVDVGTINVRAKE